MKETKKITTTEIIKFLRGKTKKEKKEIMFNYFHKKVYEKNNKLH